MKNLDAPLYHKAFQYIYIEKSIRNHPNTQNVLRHFPDSTLIEITHYKDIFCRGKQNIIRQKQAPALILARKDGQFLYPGAPVCQNFGNTNFYYCSCMMNCLYECEYCYLQGMYASGHVVLFVNLEDSLAELEELLKTKTIYLCVSYDTDLLALEHLTGYVKRWIQFAKEHPALTIEIRTKSANSMLLKDISPVPNVIFAWTFSPSPIASQYEHFAPSTQARINAASVLQNAGWNIRLCFDPILYHRNWKSLYVNLIHQIFQKLDHTKILDISLGVFRVSKDYLKRMRKQNKNSSVLYYPYTLNDGVYEYAPSLTHEMITTLEDTLLEYISPDKLFTWETTQDGGNQE